MRMRIPAAFWTALLVVLVDCALAFADDDWSFGRSRRYGGGGPLGMDDLIQGVALLGVSFGLVFGGLVFLQTWLLTSLAAAKALAVLGLFSFLAWPVFLALLLPPASVLPLGAAYVSDAGGRDPNAALLTLFLLALAAFLYFYLMHMLLAALSPKPWGRYLFRAALALAVIGGVAGLVIGHGSLLPLMLFTLCAASAWLAWKAHGKVAARAAARKRPGQSDGK